MKCTYCEKRIWFWQKVQSLDVYDNPRHYHFMCLFHKFWSTLTDFASPTQPDKSIDILCQFIKSI